MLIKNKIAINWSSLNKYKVMFDYFKKDLKQPYITKMRMITFGTFKKFKV